MAKSAKAKREKKKDFQKPKFKVGKAKPKADNFTDTSFKARSIHVLQQNLSTSAPSASSQISHHISLLTHKSDSQRRDSLSYLTSAFHNAPAAPIAPSVILPKIQPLILDASGSVRGQVLKLLQEFEPKDLAQNMETLVLYVRAAMTHLSVSIRVTGVEVLDLLLDKTGPELVGLASGWVKTLQVFMTLLRWSAPDEARNPAQTGARVPTNAGWQAASATAGKSQDEIKLLSKTLKCLGTFLDTGLVEKRDLAAIQLQQARAVFPLHNTHAYMMPTKSNAFGYLNLFGSPRNPEEEAYEDAEERRKVFEDMFGGAVRAGLEKMKREGGMIGREASETKRRLDAISKSS